MKLTERIRGIIENEVRQNKIRSDAFGSLELGLRHHVVLSMLDKNYNLIREAKKHFIQILGYERVIHGDTTRGDLPYDRVYKNVTVMSFHRYQVKDHYDYLYSALENGYQPFHGTRWNGGGGYSGVKIFLPPELAESWPGY
jgi:hypothetical protein